MFHKHFLLSDLRTTFEIQNNISKLMFRVKFTDYSTVDPNVQPQGPQTVVSPYQTAIKRIDVLAKVLNGNISVTRHSGKLGTKQLVASTRIMDLAEICANGEGVVEIRRDDTVAQIAGQPSATIAMFAVELSNVGSIHTDKSDFLKIDLDGFAKYDDGAGNQYDASIDVYSLGSYMVRNEHIKYSPIACQSMALQSFDCQSHYALAVPKTLVKANLSSASGEMLEILKEEMEIVAADLSDTVFLVDGVPVLLYNWRVFPIQYAYKAQVQLSQQGTCYIIGNKNFEAGNIYPEH